MAETDVPFIVGVIREKEKALLEDDEYVRLIGAATSPDQTREALADTAYGIYVANNLTSIAALDARLVDEFQWLARMLGKEDGALTFIAARYDAVHIAAALLNYKLGMSAATLHVPLGLLTSELLTATIWQNQGWADVPGAWRTFLQDQRLQLDAATWTRKEVLAATAQQQLRVMRESGRSPLMRHITALSEERTEKEEQFRPDELPQDISAYEKDWDVRLLSALKQHRLEPDSIDTVVAWWYALVVEVKTLRLILTAASGGMDALALSELKRPLYLPWT